MSWLEEQAALSIEVEKQEKVQREKHQEIINGLEKRQLPDGFFQVLPDLAIACQTDRVLIKEDPPPTKAGILSLAKDSQRPTSFGTIVAMGPDAYFYKNVKGELVSTRLKVGDRVGYGNYAGTEYSFKQGPQDPGDGGYKLMGWQEVSNRFMGVVTSNEQHPPLAQTEFQRVGGNQ